MNDDCPASPTWQINWRRLLSREHEDRLDWLENQQHRAEPGLMLFLLAVTAATGFLAALLTHRASR